MSHVAPPNPASYWVFVEGQIRTIGYSPQISFQVMKIHTRHIDGIQNMGPVQVSGQLVIDKPVVICRQPVTLLPMVTLTLRKIEYGKAYIQVSAHPAIDVVRKV